MLAACGGTGEEKAEGPPWGLDSVALPADAASVVAALETLPQEVGGLARSASDDTALSADALLSGEPTSVGLELVLCVRRSL